VSPELIADPLYTKSSLIIQSDDAIVKKLASEFFEDKSLGETALERLRRGVYNLIKTKTPYTPLMSSAAEVARSQSGDCIDHAMLLAAIIRARGVPARVAIGLVFNGSKDEPAMVLHSWTEVYLKDHWVCIDASVDTSSTNASYLKLVDTPFADQNPYAPLLATLQAIDLIELLVLD
jgi:transglutaminase-like putative cysteine protease